MSFTSDLIDGWAQMLAAADLGLRYPLVWHPDGSAYAATDTGIGRNTLPLSCNRAVGLTPYGLADDPTMNTSEVGIQVKLRSQAQDPRDVWALDDAIANYLLGRYPFTLPTGIRVVTLQRTAVTGLGQEDGGQQRWLWTASYPLSLYRPTPHRT